MNRRREGGKEKGWRERERKEGSEGDKEGRKGKMTDTYCNHLFFSGRSRMYKSYLPLN